jgi:hypothetical protein
MSVTITLKSIDVIKDGDTGLSGKGDFRFFYKVQQGPGDGFVRLPNHGATRDVVLGQGFTEITEKVIKLSDGESRAFNKVIQVDVAGPLWISWTAVDEDTVGFNAAGGLAVACWPSSAETHHSTVADREGGGMKVVFNWSVTFNPMNWDDFFSPRLNGDTFVFIKCLGSVDGPRWLDGRPQSGWVGLASNLIGDWATGNLTGTLWRCRRLPDDFNKNRQVVTLQCQGKLEGNRWLDAYTVDGGVYLSQQNVSRDPRMSGTRWEIVQDVDRDAQNATGLRCLGNIKGYQYLDGNTVDGTVRLQNDLARGFSGARWHFFETTKLYGDIPV